MPYFNPDLHVMSTVAN